MLALTRPLPVKTQGFTLIELMVVLALAAIIATFAVPSFQSAMARQKLNLAASDLLVSVMQARSEAIKNNRRAIVQPIDSTNWSRGWLIHVAMDNNNSYDEGTDTLIATVPPAADSVVQYEAVRKPSVGNVIGFDPNGFVLERDAGRVVFSSSILGSGYKKGVIISITGRARICTSQPSSDGCSGAN